MAWFKTFATRIRALLNSDSVHGEIEEEMRFHVDMRVEENLRKGMSLEEARSDAERRFGRLNRIKEMGYEVRGGGSIETLAQDLRYGFRILWRNPGFTLVAVITLAIGIGANTAIFSLVSAVLVRPLSYHDPDRLVMVWEDASAIGFPRDTPAPGNYADWKAQNHVFQDMAALQQQNMDLTGQGEPEKLSALAVTSNFFSLLGVSPLLGRDFLPEEDKPGGSNVVIISYGLWQNRFAGQRDVVGKDMLLEDEKYTIVGVMPMGFQFDAPEVQVCVPIALTAEQLTNHDSHFLEVVARLKPGTTVGQANADIHAIMGRIAVAYPDAAAGLGAEVVSLRDHLTGPVRRPLLILVVAVCFVLLIACANIAGVLLSRATARQREIAVRAALGASRWRIIRQLLTESVLLGAAGGILGTMLAVLTFSFLRQLIPAGMRDATSLELNLPVLVFSLAISLLAGVFFGLAPALLASRTDLNSALKQGSGRTGFGVGQPWLRNTFVIGQITLSLVLLIAAGLLIQTLFKLRGQYSELRPEKVLTVRTQLAENRYREHSKRSAFYSQVLERVQRLPGVLAAGYTTTVPLVWKGGANGLTLEGRQQAQGLGWNANHRQISPDYFRAVGISVRQGRTFTDADDETAQPVSIINETMSRMYWPGESPIMKRFKVGSADSEDPWLTIVGVVSDVRQMGADAPVKPEMYIPYRQASFYRFFTPRDLVIRTAVPPSSLVPAVRQAIYEVDPYQPLSNLRTLDEVLGRETAQRRIGMILLSVFAGVALLLAALGIYGVLSYFVVQHTPEIGIRMALGANPIDVLRLVVGKGMRLAFAGVAVGLISAFMLTRLMQSVLYGISATDPLTFCMIAVLLILVALVACLIPARRAARVDPMIALRFE